MRSLFLIFLVWLHVGSCFAKRCYSGCRDHLGSCGDRDSCRRGGPCACCKPAIQGGLMEDPDGQYVDWHYCNGVLGKYCEFNCPHVCCSDGMNVAESMKFYNYSNHGSLSSTERKHYILNLNIKPWTQPISHSSACDAINALQSSTTNNGSGAVSGGQMPAFAEGVSKLHQTDVLNSLLLAQAAASAVADYRYEMDKWYQQYVDVLNNIGWVIRQVRFQDYNPSGATVEMNKLAVSIIGSLISGDPLLVLGATVDGLKNMDPESEAVKVFNSFSNKQGGGNAAVSTAYEDKQGHVNMAISYLYFKSQEYHHRFLFWTWDTSAIQIKFGSQLVILNEDVYGQVRETVVQKLGDHARKYIKDVKLKWPS